MTYRAVDQAVTTAIATGVEYHQFGVLDVPERVEHLFEERSPV